MFWVVTVQADTHVDDLTLEARVQVKQFAGALKSTLQQGMKTGEPAKAIELCNHQAPVIAVEASQDAWQVGRTALKTRNPDNRPDSWELQVLEDFERRKAAGESIARLETAVEIDGNFRYMKAIPTGGLCLSCHGDDLSEPVAAKLRQLYPDDQATGFQAGDIRGAFTLTKKLAAA
jgi:hypothetical protein